MSSFLTNPRKKTALSAGAQRGQGPGKGKKKPGNSSLRIFEKRGLSLMCISEGKKGEKKGRFPLANGQRRGWLA